MIINIPLQIDDATIQGQERGCCILFSYGVPDRYQIERFTERPLWCELEGEDDGCNT